MGFNRNGVDAGIAAAALVAAGAAMAAALERGLWATATTAALVAALLCGSLWLAVARPRTTPAPAVATRDDEHATLRLLLDQVPGPLLGIEPDGQVRALNRAARRLFGTDDRVLPAPPALLSNDATRFRAGRRTWRIDRVTVEGLGAARTVVALVDVEADEHAAEARATRELLRILGHEIMNAMAPIASLAESALDVLDTPERPMLPEMLGTLARRADALRRFTEVYRQVARLPEPSLAPVALPDLLDDVARLFAGEWQKRATLRVVACPDAIASLDRGQIVQALLALLRNGAEAMLSAGMPAIVRLGVAVDEDRVVFLVTDEGPGVGAGNRAAIFTPFFTTKPDGNGIGLTAARQIAQGHGGDAMLRPGAPTTFELSLPQ